MLCIIQILVLFSSERRNSWKFSSNAVTAGAVSSVFSVATEMLSLFKFALTAF